MDRIREIPSAAAMASVLKINRQRSARGDVPRVAVLTFGCQQNEADSEKLLGMAVAMGYLPTERAEEASLILFNTCAVREHAEQKVLSIIGGFKRVKRERPDTVIGVLGCMAAEEHRVLQLKESYPYVDFTMSPSSIARLPEVLLDRLSGGKRSFHTACLPTVAEGITPYRRGGDRAYVSIMHGCNNFCSYCIVPYVRGRERSRATEDILSEVEGLISSGVREITLLGQNVNSYRDKTDFAGLLGTLADLPGDFLLRFMTSHPKDVSPHLVKVIGEKEKIAPAFHLPLQSGSDRILSLMNRRYDTKKYLETVKALRASRPGITLTSDIIVAFPTETEEDFEKTLDMLRTVRFDMVYSFLYSPRVGTPAAAMDGHLPEGVRTDRMNRLLALQGDIAGEIGKTYIGKTLRVLDEGPSKGDGGRHTGRTDGGKLVHYSPEGTPPGGFKTVHIDRADAYAMYGTLKESEDKK